MAEPFLGEIRIVGFNFAPRGWAFCDGQILPINQNQSLYSLLGTTFGGDGRVTFALPDLRGRTPVHPGTGGGHTVTLGQRAGVEAHTLVLAELPAHRHSLPVTQSPAGSRSPQDGPPAMATTHAYAPGDPDDLLAFAPPAIGGVGGGQAHDNMQPYLTVHFCIAMQGLFPARN